MASEKQMSMEEAATGPAPDEPPEQDVRADAVVPFDPTHGQARREEFSAVEIQMPVETASVATAAQARAAIEARYVMAERHPRDLDQVRQRLLKECQRPSFAAVARYRKPIGKGIEGPSIRFAETALRCMTNVMTQAPAIYDDGRKRILRVSVTDLEANVSFDKDVTIVKTVERSKPNDDGTFISVRKNSYGRNVFTVEATEDDLLNKEGALVSKAIRTQGLRLIPGDVVEEAQQLIMKTLRDSTAQDPDAERKKIADAFGSIGVQVADLKSYLGQDLGSVTAAQLVELRTLYTAVKDGELTWKDVTDAKGVEPAENGPSKTERLKSKLGKSEATA